MTKLMTAREIADRCGVDRRSATRWRTYESFPQPVEQVTISYKQTYRYDWDEVRAWLVDRQQWDEVIDAPDRNGWRHRPRRRRR